MSEERESFWEMLSILESIRPDAADILWDVMYVRKHSGIRRSSNFLGRCKAVENHLMWRRLPRGFEFWESVDAAYEAFYKDWFES